MRIKYKHFTPFGKEVDRDDSIEQFVADQLIHDRDIRLEHQPAKVAEALGRLLNFLLEKGMMSPEEFHEVVGTEWPLRDRSQITQEE